MSQWQGAPPQSPYGMPPQGPFGQGPYDPGPYGPAPAPGFGPPPGGGYPPPPQRSNTGVFVALGIAALVLVVAAAGGALYLMGSGGGKHSGAQASPQMHDSLPPSGGSSAPPVTGAPANPPSGGSAAADVLTPTFKTAWGDIFTRLQTRDGDCATYANAALKTVLAAHPCAGSITSALYRNAAGNAQVTVTIMKFGSTADADAVAAAADTKSAYPVLITTLHGQVNMWISDKSQGAWVVYAHGINPSGGSDGPRGGPVFTAAVHLSTEIRNVLIWKN